jgi:hypothetical protein
MPEPLLDFSDIGVIRECVGRGGRSQGMHAQTVHLGINATEYTVVAHDIAVDRRGIEGSRQFWPVSCCSSLANRRSY